MADGASQGQHGPGDRHHGIPERERGRQMATTRFDLPTTDDFTQPWWDAVAEGRLLIMRCSTCGEAHYYPRPFCPRCGADTVSWEQASGDATLYTWSIVYQNDLPPFNERVPYVAAVVDLAEGPRMMTNVVGCEFDDLAVGMALRLEITDIADGFHVPMFRPAS
jgi:uncharacterized protein